MFASGEIMVLPGMTWADTRGLYSHRPGLQVWDLWGWGGIRFSSWGPHAWGGVRTTAEVA
jgi:hypothetical protein